MHYTSIYSSHKLVMGPYEQGTVLETAMITGRGRHSLLPCACHSGRRDIDPADVHSISIVITASPSEPDWPGAQSGSNPKYKPCLWASHLISLSWGSLICKKGIVISTL